MRAEEAIRQQSDEDTFAAYTPDADILEQLPELVQTLETSFVPRWEGLQEFLIMDEVKRFAGELSQLARKYHPDKLEHLGDEFKALAETRFKEIQKAYQELSGKGN